VSDPADGTAGAAAAEADADSADAETDARTAAEPAAGGTGGGDGGANEADAVETDAVEADASEADAIGIEADAVERSALRPFDTLRWVGLTGVTLLFVGLGIVLRQASLVLVGGVGIGYVVYTEYGEAPTPDLEVTRSVRDSAPDPGDEVDVTVRVRNVGDGALPDVRLVDGVPPALEVESGPARLATALRPGATASFTYTVSATRGAHEWEPLRVLSRNPAGSRERETAFDAPTTLRCTPELGAGADLPLRGLTTQYHGRVSTDVGGSGVEFFATREYRRGDPLRRVDWNRRARTGELATLELREERAATVVLLVDARDEAYRAPESSAENAVERSVEAAGEVFTALEAGGDRVGVAAMASGDCWLAPGAGTDHARRARDLLATHPSLAPLPTEELFYPSLWLRRLRRRLPGEAQVLLFAPLTDGYPVTVARRLDAYGHLVTVISPDVTATDTAGRKLARLERQGRVRELRGAGIRVVDWGEDPLAAAVTSARRSWR